MLLVASSGPLMHSSPHSPGCKRTSKRAPRAWPILSNVASDGRYEPLSMRDTADCLVFNASAS